MTNGQANTCGSAKVVHDKRNVSQVKIQDEPLQVVDVVLKEIVPVLGRLAFSEAHMVGCDHSMPRRKGLDEVPKQVSPGWLAVKDQNGLTLALVHVVHPKAHVPSKVSLGGTASSCGNSFLFAMYYLL